MVAGAAQGRAKQDTARALAYALAGFALLATGDAIVKTMADEWPASAIAALRYVIGTAGLIVLVAVTYGRAGFIAPLPALQLARGLAVGAATLCFFLSITFMPLADATAIIFTGPLWTALLSALLLRERPTRAMLGATLLALVGTLVILRPNVAALGAAALLPLGSAICMSLLFILNRRVAGLAPVFTMQLVQAAAATPMLIAFAWAGDVGGPPALAVGPPSASVILRCAIVAATATTGHWFIFRATEMAAASTIAPMTYVQILVAIAGGWLLFGDRPDAPMLAGVALIIAGGLWLWRAGRAREVDPPPG